MATAIALTAASCGGRDDPFRLAVQVDCQGGFASFSDIQLAGAFLPLLERGARLAGPSLKQGVSGVHVAGEPVDVRVACTESAESTVSVPELRRLLDEWAPNAVVSSGLLPQDGLIVRDLAKRYPDVTFFVTTPTAQEITLFDPSPNVFRVGADDAQSVAGLASYAYRQLGWRRAAVVAPAYPDDWEQAAGFVAEFCSLGGTATRDDGRAWADPAGTAARYASSVDGVAVLPAFVPPTALLQAMAKLHRHKLATRLVLGGWAYLTPSNFVTPGADLSDVVVATALPRSTGPPAWRRYIASFAKAYPRLPAGTAKEGLVVTYRNAVAAFAAAFEETAGDPGREGQRLREALAHMTVPAVPDPVVFDRNHQAVVSVYLSRVGKRPQGRASAPPVGVVREIDQAYEGLFGPPHGPPTAVSPACRRTGKPPSWAR
jgi:branched-chain amino acid transport system substrate-binding protein